MSIATDISAVRFAIFACRYTVGAAGGASFTVTCFKLFYRVTAVNPLST